MVRRARVYEYSTPNWDKGYIFAKNLDSAKKKAPLNAFNWSFYDRSTKQNYLSSLDKFGRYTR